MKKYVIEFHVKGNRGPYWYSHFLIAAKVENGNIKSYFDYRKFCSNYGIYTSVSEERWNETYPNYVSEKTYSELLDAEENARYGL